MKTKAHSTIHLKETQAQQKMGIMAPIRVYVISNLTASLFMAAHFRQENLKDSGFRNICVVLLEENVNQDDPVMNPLKEIAKLISSETIFCRAPVKRYINLTIGNIASERKRKKAYLKRVRSLLQEHSIDKNEIKEVYHGHQNFHQYLKYLNPKIRLIGFEHGTSEVRNYLLSSHIIQKIRDFLRTVLARLLIIFNAYAKNDNEIVSLLASNIKPFNKKLLTASLKSEYFIEVADRIVQNDITNSQILNDDNKIAIILLSPLHPYFTNDLDEHFEFHKSVLSRIIEQLQESAPEINTIVIKAQHGDEHFPKIKSKLSEHFKQYRLLTFDDICATNYPVECYLNIIRPKAILANISAGLFYTKVLMPNVKTYTFHPLMIDRLQKFFGEIYPDYPWILDIFYNKYEAAFKDLLPIKMSV